MERTVGGNLNGNVNGGAGIITIVTSNSSFNISPGCPSVAIQHPLTFHTVPHSQVVTPGLGKPIYVWIYTPSVWVSL